MICRLFGAAAILAVSAGVSSAAVYGGIEFPDGAASFADVVVDYRIGDAVEAPYDDPNEVLGIPDYIGPAGYSASGAFSLGHPGRDPDNIDDALRGYVTVRFTDNSLTTSGDDAADLFVYEVGGRVEAFKVEISTDSLTWITVGVLSGQPTEIDIDAVAGVVQGEKYSFVRVSDVLGGPDTGKPYGGPDIDAIGAISSAEAVDVPTVPLPAASWLLVGGLAGLARMRRRG